MLEQLAVPWWKLQPMESPCRSKLLTGTVVHGEELMLEQVNPQELYPVERTHVGAVPDELQPMGRTHAEEVNEGLCPVGGTLHWSSGRV